MVTVTRARECVGCGYHFTSANRLCHRCRKTYRQCDLCERWFTSAQRRCSACRKSKRTCTCGRVFRGAELQCVSCRSIDRVCVGCGDQFRSNRRECFRCRPTSRTLRALAVQLGAPVSVSRYAEIVREGPCVYCGASASSVDHVWPLVQGGWEGEGNLVPACEWCNSSKGSHLLTEWYRTDLVQHATEVSEKVAHELTRLVLTG